MKDLTNRGTNVQIPETTFSKINAKMSVKWIIGIVFLACTLFICFVGVLPQRLELKENDIAQENIVAPRRIVDEKMTEALRNQAESMTAPVYDYIPSAKSQSLSKIDSLFASAEKIRVELLTNKNVASFNEVCGVSLSKEDYIFLSEMSKQKRSYFKRTLYNLLNKAYEGDVRDSQLEDVKKSLAKQIDKTNLSEQEKELGTEILQAAIRPNMLLNEDSTAIAVQAARDSVYEVVYEAGQTIINKGEVITARHIQLFKDNGLIRTGFWLGTSDAIGTISLIVILTVLYISYLYFYHPKIFKSNKMLMLIAAQFIFMMVIGQVCAFFSMYFIPVAMLTMSFCLIFNSRVAVQSNLFLMLFLAVSLQLDVDSFIYLSVSGYLGIVFMQRISSRAQIFKSGIFVGLGNAIMVLVISVYRSNYTVRMFNDVVFGIGNGAVAAILTIGLLMVWETVFNIVTPFKLLEMSSPNDYVIQKLITDAPGTYHHSLVVSNMAEAACREIRANQLLARVGAYYHDIGKAEKAMYFKENQSGKANPHDSIAPEVSAAIIKNHVSDGVNLAQKYHIPEEITEFIRTHHGTSEITYFKVKAEEEGYEGNEDFVYHGALPETRETSVVMLADSIEAAVRSLSSPDEESIRAMIERIVAKKVKEGQLKASHLQMNELEKVKRSFADVLKSVYHSRIKYPNQEKEEELVKEKQADKEQENYD